MPPQQQAIPTTLPHCRFMPLDLCHPNLTIWIPDLKGMFSIRPCPTEGRTVLAESTSEWAPHSSQHTPEWLVSAGLPPGTWAQPRVTLTEVGCSRLPAGEEGCSLADGLRGQPSNGMEGHFLLPSGKGGCSRGYGLGSSLESAPNP